MCVCVGVMVVVTFIPETDYLRASAVRENQRILKCLKSHPKLNYVS